jgi:hypothetical protein
MTMYAITGITGAVARTLLAEGRMCGRLRAM